jgi:hypothetical protein
MRTESNFIALLLCLTTVEDVFSSFISHTRVPRHSSLLIRKNVESTGNQRMTPPVKSPVEDMGGAAKGVQQNFIIHRGRSAAMIKRSPSIAGISFCKGWADNATQAFVSAVESLGMN